MQGFSTHPVDNLYKFLSYPHLNIVSRHHFQSFRRYLSVTIEQSVQTLILWLLLTALPKRQHPSGIGHHPTRTCVVRSDP